MPLRLHTAWGEMVSMNNQNRPLQHTRPSDLGDLVEALATLFARAGEMEEFGQAELAGLRMGEVIRIAAARKDFEHFRNTLSSEISDLQKRLDAAVAIGESRGERPTCSELFGNASAQRSPVWRLGGPHNRKSRLLSQHDSRMNGLAAEPGRKAGGA
jgi:hypothetical protein